MKTPWGAIEIQTREDMPEGTMAIVRTLPTRDEMRQCRKQCTTPDGRWLISWNDYMTCLRQTLARKATVIKNVGQDNGPASEETEPLPADKAGDV
jgi:hypothetical protein